MEQDIAWGALDLRKRQILTVVITPEKELSSTNFFLSFSLLICLGHVMIFFFHILLSGGRKVVSVTSFPVINIPPVARFSVKKKKDRLFVESLDEIRNCSYQRYFDCIYKYMGSATR